MRDGRWEGTKEFKGIKDDVVGGKGSVQNLHVAQTYPKLHKFSNLPTLSTSLAKRPKTLAPLRGKGLVILYTVIGASGVPGVTRQPRRA